MINYGEYSRMGKFKYCEEYELDTKEKCIRKHSIFVKSYKNFRNITVTAERIVEDYKPAYFVITLSADVLINKNSNLTKRFNLKCNSDNVFSVDRALSILETHFKHGPKLKQQDKQMNYTLSEDKTENEFNVVIGYFKDSKGNKYDINVTVDKDNVVNSLDEEIYTVEKIVDSEIGLSLEKYNTYVYPIEGYILYFSGFLKITDRSDYQYTFFDNNDVLNQLNVTELIEKNNIFYQLIPGFYTHTRYELYHGNTLAEAYNVEYDELGFLLDIDFPKYPVIYERYYDEETADVQSIYSLHPLHFDYANFETKYTDNLYCQDSVELSGLHDNHIIIYSRHVRELSDEERDRLKNDYHDTPVSVLEYKEFEVLEFENL